MPRYRIPLTAAVLLSAGLALSPRPAPAQTTPTAEPGEGRCTLSGRQVADVERIERGQSLGLRLYLEADCPSTAKGRADIMLLYDRSASMSADGKHQAAVAAAQTFLSNVDFSRHRVALVPFNEQPSIIQPLTDRLDRLQRALAATPGPGGSTNIALALRVAATELAATARPEAVGVVVLMTDGQDNEEAMRSAAQEVRDNGTVLFTIGLGADAAQRELRAIATSPEHYYFAPEADDLEEIYQRIASIIQTFTVTDIQLVDEPAPGVQYISGSAYPGEPLRAGGLMWRQPFVAPGGIMISYRVRPTRAGPGQPSRAVWASYADGDGVRRRLDIAPAVVDVYAPAIRPFFLPLLFRNQCLPAIRHADVVLVMDVSNSMNEDNKLAEAIDAAKAFLRVLKLPQDQAALVTFHGDASLTQPLTGDRALLEARLDGLTTRSGTRIDRGIETALAELTGPRHRGANRQVMIVLTDGKQIEERSRIFVTAEQARRLGVVLFAIALGPDADLAALEVAAGGPARVYRAVGPRDLMDIYTQIAGIVACR